MPVFKTGAFNHSATLPRAALSGSLGPAIGVRGAGEKGIHAGRRVWQGHAMRICLVAGLLLLTAVPAAADETAPVDGFGVWLANYRAAAVTRGLRPEWLAAALDGARYSQAVVDLDRDQPDDSGRRAVLADYLARQLSAQRIEDGLVRAQEHGAVLKRIAAETGVPAEIILAIWGLETSYGRVMGGFDLPSALATLAYDGRRAALFTGELDALVRIVGEGRLHRSALTGSWAGAFGQPQFLPSSYLAYAVDGDGDGRADIRGSTADTFASIANYLARNGWQPGIGWGFAVRVPAGFSADSVANPVAPTRCVRPLAAHSRTLPARDWKANGFAPLNAAWPGDEVPMSFVQPDGPGTAAYLTTPSYRAIMAYNCSNFYALSVALLGDRVAHLVR